MGGALARLGDDRARGGQVRRLGVRRPRGSRGGGDGVGPRVAQGEQRQAVAVLDHAQDGIRARTACARLCRPGRDEPHIAGRRSIALWLRPSSTSCRRATTPYSAAGQVGQGQIRGCSQFATVFVVNCEHPQRVPRKVLGGTRGLRRKGARGPDKSPTEWTPGAVGNCGGGSPEDTAAAISGSGPSAAASPSPTPAARSA